ncbi:unnamed protein product [Spirodela intermedia]|uniref:Terpene synthase N-terminal domain-containing protein n=1 Tax=Spirodela intermedia TaxID=51605 RepID=A0A7I8IPP3_SPIIN|nr:unnamed protein product [Spirodela intermedia]CAA6659112.1 unnamed protein product [Spirodela intermedia]
MAATSPGNTVQVALSPPVFLRKPESLSGTSLLLFLSLPPRLDDEQEYMCHAISEKPPPLSKKVSSDTHSIVFYEALCRTDDDAATVAEGTQVMVSVGYNGSECGIPVVFTPEGTSESDGQGESAEEKGVNKRVAKIKAMLRSSSQPQRRRRPQFPSSLKWIEENQLPDGSWGDGELFIAHDRLMNTLACVIALKSWGVCPDRSQRGISFLWANMKRLDEEDLELMPIGFEVAFPSLVEMARSLDLDVPLDSPALEEIYARKSLKLKRIPKDLLHEVPTTLLHSLEGMGGLDWEKILRLQCADGSLLFSPSSTAFALMCTGDIKCFDYLQRIVRRFNGGVPNVYPVDLFERLWAVDRLERLGISRYFLEEIRRCLDYVYEYWTSDGISWARSSRVQDVDDTSMGFRLLRLHGYDVSPDVFLHFEKDGEFFCLPGQLTQAITGMYNLNRAAQVSYPGEEILQVAKSFSNEYLRERRALDKLSDKWIITKDLPGSLPRVEARFYLEQYGGDHDVWIGKTLYR